jgi:hypothetical protein
MWTIAGGILLALLILSILGLIVPIILYSIVGFAYCFIREIYHTLSATLSKTSFFARDYYKKTTSCESDLTD